MPKFAPMFRKLLNDKDKMIELTKTPVNEDCSAVILKKFPEKLGDPGRFLIPCDFPKMNECLALADLDASINLMPLSIWKELSLPALTKTQMILELADRTIFIPTGIAEDVFVKVGTFFFPVDFVVVDYVADPRVPLILGRPFLRTARALIDVHGEQMTLRHDDQSVTFKVGDTKTFSYNIIETVNRIDVIDIACEEYVQEVLEISKSGNPTSTSDLMIDSRSPSFTPFGGSDFLMEEIDAFLEHDDSIPPGVDGIYDSEGDTVYLEELLSVINSDPNLPPSPVCEINVPEKVKSSCEDPPDLKLKDLPSHLEYAFLEGGDKLPVIIAKNLKNEDKTALIKFLKSHKRAIAWKIFDIKGIDPQFCTRKILMEENIKPVVQHQRIVNPKIHEVIKQEVIKLLDAGLIYPISDSPWVFSVILSTWPFPFRQICSKVLKTPDSCAKLGKMHFMAGNFCDKECSLRRKEKFFKDVNTTFGTTLSIQDCADQSVNDTLTAELERYKEQVKVLKEGQNVDLRSKDNVSDTCAQSVEIDLLKQTLSEHLKEKESLLQTVTLLKNDFKKEESRNIDREIALEKQIKQLDNIVFKRDQSAQTVHMLTKPQFFYDNTTKQALGFQNPFYLQKAQQSKPKLYVGDIIVQTNPIVIPDSEETLALAEESRSKMLLKHKDNMMLEKEKQVDTTPIDYAALNQLYKDFPTRFVPQTELSAEQAFWSQNSVNSSEPTLSIRPTNVEVPKELPKVSMVNTSLKKLKHHLANFDVVVKERTTPTAITEGSWGFEHTKACFRDEIIPFVKALKDLFSTFNQHLVDELSEVQNVFYQMEQAVEQHRIESKTFEVKMNQVLNENERLLEQVMSKDIMNLLVNPFVENDSVNVHECQKCLKLETELQTDFVKRETYDKLFKSFTILEKHCISLEVDTQLKQEIFQRENSVSNQSVPSFDQLFELNELKAQSQEKDTVIKKLKERIKSLSGKIDKDKIKQDLEEIETINIELDHRVTKLIAENEHLKQTYKQLYDSIKPARVKQSTSASGSQPSCNTKKDKIQQTQKPTGQTFTIVGNACPLTRITTTTEVPLRKSSALDNKTPKPVVTLVYSRKPRKSKTSVPVNNYKVVQIVLWYLDSGCSKHMTGDRSQLTNFVNKFLGTVKFGNDHVAKIMGYGDYQIGNVTISRVYYVEGLGHNLFSVGQFCDSNLEVAFRQHTCYIRNLEGVDLLTGSRGDNLYTLSLGDMMASSPICLLSKASKTKSWLWHRRLSHLNFGAINHLARHGLVRGLPKLKFEKDHLCSACA
ncbi:retrovirus-related pol polyprotein from transposon TNT 1-94 [Tanacetum coccineum]